jgi:hypothetical protein
LLRKQNVETQPKSSAEEPESLEWFNVLVRQVNMLPNIPRVPVLCCS